jgi:hypothetical protein
MPQTIEDYRRHMHTCMANAERSRTKEIRELWQSIAGSYRFLLQREERIETETRLRDASVAKASLLVAG